MEKVGVLAEEGSNSNRIQVCDTKKPLSFYVNLAKKYMKEHNEVELSAEGMAITTVVKISEFLKTEKGLAIVKKISTSAFECEYKGKMVKKPKIEIVLGKSENFDTLVGTIASAAGEKNDDDGAKKRKVAEEGKGESGAPGDGAKKRKVAEEGKGESGAPGAGGEEPEMNSEEEDKEYNEMKFQDVDGLCMRCVRDEKKHPTLMCKECIKKAKQTFTRIDRLEKREKKCEEKLEDIGRKLKEAREKLYLLNSNMLGKDITEYE